jgi:hypothetical protein
MTDHTQNDSNIDPEEKAKEIRNSMPIEEADDLARGGSESDETSFPEDTDGVGEENTFPSAD